MPAKSKKQQMAAGAALSAKRGEKSKGSLRGASKQMVKSMSEKELEKLASTKRKKLPTKKTSSGGKGKSAASKKSTGKKSGSTKSSARKTATKKTGGKKKSTSRR